MEIVVCSHYASCPQCVHIGLKRENDTKTNGKQNNNNNNTKKRERNKTEQKKKNRVNQTENKKALSWTLVLFTSLRHMRSFLFFVVVYIYIFEHTACSL